MIRILILCGAVMPGVAFADTVVAARTIRSQAILGPSDLAMVSSDVPGGFADPNAVIGLEARVVLYAGRPIRASDVGPPALVERNQIVMVYYRAGSLNIVMEGRTLARAGVGDRLRVMNLESRNTVTGTVTENGSIIVTNALP